MNKHRFLEDASEWVYNHMIGYKYGLYGDDYWTGIIIMFFAACLLFCIYWLFHGIIYDWIDKKTGELTTYTGTLIDKKYIGESDSSGTGTAMVSTGSGVGVGLVSTSSHSDEEFLFFIDADEVYKCEVDMQKYYRFKIEDKVQFTVFRGGKSGKILETKLN